LLGAAIAIPQAQAAFSLDGGTNFAVLYVGQGAQTLSINNGPGPGNEAVNGNIGVANTGKIQLSGPLTINGNILFAAPNTGQCTPNGCVSQGNITVNGTVSYSQASPTTTLAALSTLSQNLGAEPGTALSITPGGSVNANAGTLDGSGNRVFTLTPGNTFPNGTFTITGTSSQFVVVNIPSTGGFTFNGAIALSGGITSDQVLFNFTSGNYVTNTGGDKLNFTAAGATTTGTYLDLNGDFNINSTVLNGRVFSGDALNSSIVSGGDVIAPPPPQPPLVPEPGTLALIGSALVIFGIARRRKSV